MSDMVPCNVPPRCPHHPDDSDHEETDCPTPWQTQKDVLNNRYVIVMVGLPARGKSYISMRMAIYLNWRGIGTKVFNVGSYRRKAVSDVTKDYCHHDFFLPNNDQAMKIREESARRCLEDMIGWLKKPCQEVAIFDATNVTEERRKFLYDSVTKEGFGIFFLESICTDEDVVKATIQEVKVHGADYIGINPEEAMADFMKRIGHYKSVYVPVGTNEGEKHYSYLKNINAGRKFEINLATDRFYKRIIYFLMHTRITPHTIYLVRHGETYFNVQGRIGGDSDLTENGEGFAKELGNYFDKENIKDLVVWTSLSKRTIQTARHISARKERWEQLNDIDAGEFDGWTYAEIKAKFPNEYEARDRDKLRYRYPGQSGESYMDIIQRVEDLIMDMEGFNNIVVVGHQAVLRCLYCYFTGKAVSDLPYIRIPMHQVVKMVIEPNCHQEKIEKFDVPTVDTHRAREFTDYGPIPPHANGEPRRKTSSKLGLGRGRIVLADPPRSNGQCQEFLKQYYSVSSRRLLSEEKNGHEEKNGSEDNGAQNGATETQHEDESSQNGTTEIRREERAQNGASEQ